MHGDVNNRTGETSDRASGDSPTKNPRDVDVSVFISDLQREDRPSGNLQAGAWMAGNHQRRA